MLRYLFKFLILLLVFVNLNGEEIPALWKGRIRPLEVTAADWCKEIGFTDVDPLETLWKAHFHGLQAFNDTPLFTLPSGKKSSYTNLPTALAGENFSLLITGAYADKYLSPQNRSGAPKLEILPAVWATYEEGAIVILSTPEHLLGKNIAEGSRFPLQAPLETTQKNYSRVKLAWEDFLHHFALYESWRLAALPEEGPLQQQLHHLQDPLVTLPKSGGGWVGLRALGLRPAVKNFTAYSDSDYKKIVAVYQDSPDPTRLSAHLAAAYVPLAGSVAADSTRYPSLWQLRLEKIFCLYPWHEGLILLYLLAILALVCMPKAGIPLLSAAFALHSTLLLVRWVILERPPVSNMYETVLYVPWVAVAIGWFFVRRDRYVSIASAVAAALLLLCLPLSDLDRGLENVQAVLNSPYWLTIHVLMVVGSYGAFFLAGAIAHLYLLFPKKWAGAATSLLPTLYIASGLLIAGTILGGVWAAQSWGRFWDWDPKESWAFITACYYLILIHAVRFRWIGEKGVAVGAIGGLLFVSFTWYGVNYILGTGLHSYGFGRGGESLYLGYVLGEILFLIAILMKAKRKDEKILSKT